MSSSSSDSEVSERSGGGGEERAPVNVDDNDSDSAPSHRSASPPARQSQDSDDEDSSPVKRRVASSSEDEDDDGPRKVKPKDENLFGEDSSDEEKRERKQSPQGGDSDEDQPERRDRGDYEEEGEEREEEEEDVAPSVIEGDAVAVDMDIASFNPLFARLPNFISVAKRPFDPSYYEEDDDDEALDAEGRNRLKLKVENTIRWRSIQNEEGEEMKESNAKMVRWSDGTMSMYLGNEVFEVQVQDISDYNHLYIRQGQGLVGQAVFREKMNLRPFSTDSVTHKKMTMSMAEKTRKSGQVKMVSSVGINPDAEKRDLVRKEEEALRAAYRRDLAQGRSKLKGRYSGMTSSFLEGRDDSDDESPSAIKSRYGKGGKYDDRPLIGASDSEDSDRERRLKEAQKDSDADSDESDLRQKKQQKKQIVTSDEDSD